MILFLLISWTSGRTNWKDSLRFFKDVLISRTHTSFHLSKTICTELHIFSDASEAAIASVAYLRRVYDTNNILVVFILEKNKLVPKNWHSISCLELCAAVLSVQFYDIIIEELDMKFKSIRFYTTRMVVLDHIHNKSKRFFKYVKNRVKRIRKLTTYNQWSYVPTKSNPGDADTRNMKAKVNYDNISIRGPP